MEAEAVLEDVVAFFRGLDYANINLPKITISPALTDAASYNGNGLIELNPKRNTEGLSIEEMVAHEFFHHVQHELFWKTLARPLSNDQEAAMYEFFEGTAFLFAALYVNRRQMGAASIQNYMMKKEHMTKSGVGNKQALRAFELSDSNPKRFVQNVLDVGFIDKFLEFL